MAEAMDEFHLASPLATHAAGAAIGTMLRGGEVIGLDGELGAGKTSLVRGIAEGLGIPGSMVSSPTFVLMQRYTGGRLDLVHADAYRVRSPEELESIGWLDDGDPGRPTVSVIEWSSRVETAIPSNAVRIELLHAGASRPSEGAGDTRVLRLRDPDSERFEHIADAIRLSALRHACRVCGRPLPPEAGPSVFCSARCRDADLGRWFGERYRVSRGLREDDFDDRG